MSSEGQDLVLFMQYKREENDKWMPFSVVPQVQMPSAEDIEQEPANNAQQNAPVNEWWCSAPLVSERLHISFNAQQYTGIRLVNANRRSAQQRQRAVAAMRSSRSARADYRHH